MENPEITILTVVYNGKRFIESCLQSVIEQRFGAAEHLIIDGGSSDGTVEIVKMYAQRYPHIRWISEKDSGQSAALNKGLRLSRASVIGILNCDDFYAPDVLRRVAAIFKSLKQPSFVVANCDVWDDQGLLIHHNRPAHLKLAELLTGGPNNEFPWNPSAYFYHKRLHERVGYYNENDHQCMDLDFILRAVEVADCRYRNETWGNFRLLPGSKTYEALQSNRLHYHKENIIQAHLKRLPLLQRWRVRAVRFLFIHKRVHYFAGRIVKYLKNPAEIFSFFSKRLEYMEKGKLWQQLDFHCLGRKPPDFMWEALPPCPAQKTEACLVKIGPLAFILGGYITLDHVSRDVHVLDLGLGRWVNSFAMPAEMAETHLGVAADSQRYIYFVAGQKGPQCHPATAKCFVLDTKQLTWGPLPPLPEARYAPAVQLWSGRLHVLGGSKPDRNTPSTDHFSIAVADGKALETQWQIESPAPRGGPHRGSAVVDGRLYLLGGEEGDLKAVKDDAGFKCDWNTPDETVYSDCFMLEKREGPWQPLPSMGFAISHTEFSTVIAGQYILLVGGNRSRREVSDKIQIFDTRSKCWKPLKQLPYPMKTSSLFHNGWLYIITGQRSKNINDPAPGRVLNSVWRADFDPARL